MNLREQLKRYIPSQTLREKFIAVRLFECDFNMLQVECERFVLSEKHDISLTSVEKMHAWFREKADTSVLKELLDSKNKFELTKAILKLMEHID